MMDLKRAMTGTTLTLNDSTETTDREQPFDFVEQLLKKDLTYTQMIGRR